jgi:predicted nucleic acid-binding protein
VLYLLDTNVVSDLIRPHAAAKAFVASTTSSDITAICPVTQAELLYGVAKLADGRKKQALHARVLDLLANFSCLPIERHTADVFAEVKRKRNLTGRSLEDSDIWIAAVAITHGATLVTRDSDFLGTDSLLLKMLM